MEFSELLHSFHMGECFNAHHFLGAHPAPGGGYLFRVWAPGARQVYVCGEFNGWQNTHPLAPSPDGVFSGTAPEARAGQLYKLNIYDGKGSWVMRPDPYAFESELRPGTASRLCDLAGLTFHDEDYLARRGQNYDKPVNIYEMHAGSFRQKEDGSWYNYEELAELLVPYLTRHGYTHVEFLPLNEHPFDGSWGYQPSGYFSVTSRYGSPAQFAALVDRLHQAGIGVLMDFVPVHFVANGDILAHFDGGPLYEYDSEVGRSEWGTCNFNFFRGEVCSFLNSAALFWLETYHCDGLRMDAISNAIYWLGNDRRGVNEGALHFLQRLNDGLHQRYPQAMLVAEDSTNYLKVTAPVQYGGLGFDYKWDMGWMHDTLNYFATPFDQRPDSYHKLTFSMSYFYQELYLLALSHDEVVHGKKNIIEKLWGQPEERWAQLRSLYFYMYTHPGKKLNFMGGELAHFREWDEARPLDWELLRYPLHDAFDRYIAQLGQLYAQRPALHEGEYNSACFAWVDCQSPLTGVYAYLRQSGGERLLCVMNTQNVAQRAYPLYLSEACEAEELLGSEWECFGGSQRPAPPTSTLPGGPAHAPHTLYADLPALGSRLFLLRPAPTPDAAPDAQP